MSSVQTSFFFFFKEIYPIFRKVLCRTLKLIILFKNHFYYVLFCNSTLMGNFTKRKASASHLVPVVVSVQQSQNQGGFWGQRCFLELRPSASRVPLTWADRKDNGTYARWLPLSHIDLGSEKAIYPPSGGRTGVSRLQGSQERCANADLVNKIKPGAAIFSGGKKQAVTHVRF